MSTMKRSFLSRLLLGGLGVALILLSPAVARADAIRTFHVSGGTAINTSGATLGSCAFGATCPVSGTFQVDTTSGKVESSGLDFTFPGLGAFDSLAVSTPNGPVWKIDVNNKSSDTLFLFFLTAPTGSSLVGLTGGTIDSFDSVVTLAPMDFYGFFSGTITPVPEPSSLVLFASGMLALGLAWRFGKKVVPST